MSNTAQGCKQFSLIRRSGTHKKPALMTSFTAQNESKCWKQFYSNRATPKFRQEKLNLNQSSSDT